MLTPELEQWKATIANHARSYGLDFFKTIFEILDWKQVNEIAAYGGFPNRYPHWRFGMEYEQLSKSYAYGLSKIYEMVINNDPCYAYLLHSNNMVDQKMVMAHVFGHCDFFKNNIFFGPTPKNMMDQMANHRVRVTRYVDKLGYEKVERFIDVCLSIDNLIDYQLPFSERKNKVVEEEEEELKQDVHRLKVDKEYLEGFINPEHFIEMQRQKQEKEDKQKTKIPLHPQKDVMGFLLEYAPLSRWEYDILHIIRDEGYYYAPQAQTKIMNEGWASYWHSKIMTEKILNDSEIIDFADHHSGTVAMTSGRLNPYKIGLEIFRDIEERWNKGRFGKEYDECEDMVEKAKWDKKLGLGREKIFEVRKIYNDVTFIESFLTPEFCARHKLFSFEFNRASNHYEIASREFKIIKEKLLFHLTNFGQPFIEVVDANYDNRAELLLKHVHHGIDLDLDYAKDVLKNMYDIWKRPVLIETQLGSQLRIYSFDGEKHKEMDTKEGI
ncbi:MAG: SpoVR family protein [Deltaproteobacteria bacterium RIFCSPLOWO2_12_FULL_40_28]|nr:MAG: SpoVR family protein [Deltaproteobacteria bacterium RIFCSPHIGHO2_02_FULL_40_28]OGQ18794.1 MAG: SpoVR family protein [Deltaproteobacteria bacterium RIFCSPHIGHO2_12_FULL_40_32]OGQ40039.1 MAG: SpoVR family protein [Deltaproteobacteria bacterium RIFCSPLOWO2_02_FULL_40_36]OGQ53222.1 MAG: SpoVR family protein [Deltaproteobacteria bacterium RIFCSPLOWO2_12_FULL_40_28]